VPVVPAHAEPRWLRREHFLDHSGTGGLADLLGLDDDASVWESLAWTAGLLAVFILLSVWRYRRMS
jgi:hypothetical protein